MKGEMGWVEIVSVRAWKRGNASGSGQVSGEILEKGAPSEVVLEFWAPSEPKGRRRCSSSSSIWIRDTGLGQN